MNQLLPSLAGVMLMGCTLMGCALAQTESEAIVEAEELGKASRPTSTPAEPAAAVPARRETTSLSLPELTGATFQAPRFEWRALGGSHWQITSSAFEDPRVTDAREGTRGACPAGMVQVKGNMKVDPDLEKKQLDTCTEWLNRGYPERCAAFNRDAWQAVSADMPEEPMAYCIDRFEYPNIVGQYPAALVSATDSAALCAEQGKRLCSEDEWTFACEGEEAQPYATGYERDAEACVVDSEWRQHDEEIFKTHGRAGAFEMDRLWQGKRSGDTQCKSPFGVYDMNGNVDEWTTSTSPTGKRSIMKGGYWGPVRARCRPSTRSHGDFHNYYQQGFRCCSDLQ